jgi:hypothetical protein
VAPGSCGRAREDDVGGDREGRPFGSPTVGAPSACDQ